MVSFVVLDFAWVLRLCVVIVCGCVFVVVFVVVIVVVCSAVLTVIGPRQLRSSGANCDRALAVEVQQCSL